jgi:chromosome segregation ATPase
MQDRYYEQISKEYGLGRGEKGSTKQHTTKAQWEAQKLEKELDIKTKELTAHQQKIEKLKSELEYAKDGSVSIPQLANKQKITEIQDQNKALAADKAREKAEKTAFTKSLNDYPKRLEEHQTKYETLLNELDEKLFDLLKDKKYLYEQPNSLRHPLIFYYGHTATFFINKLVLANIIDVPKEYQTAIEMCLGASLQNIVTETEEDAKK